MEPPISELLSRLRAAEEAAEKAREATTSIVSYYRQEMLAFARLKVAPSLQAKVSPTEAVNSSFDQVMKYLRSSPAGTRHNRDHMRALLKTSIDRWIKDEIDKHTALKRGGGVATKASDGTEPDNDSSPEKKLLVKELVIRVGQLALDSEDPVRQAVRLLSHLWDFSAAEIQEILRPVYGNIPLSTISHTSTNFKRAVQTILSHEWAQPAAR